MPANLPHQYYEAEKKLRTAKTPQEKIQIVEAMLSVIPHHKGTDKIIGQLRKRLSKLKEESESKPKAGRKEDAFKVVKEGAAQVVMAGFPNAGKSSLLISLTNADSKVADYPYTTRIPIPGIVLVGDVQVQLVDLPPITDESVETWLYNVYRNSDLIMLVADLADDPPAQVEIMVEQLQSKRICLKGTPSEHQAVLGDITKKAILVGNRADLPGAERGCRELESQYGNGMAICSVSALDGSGLESLKVDLFKCLDMVRIYTKAPGKKAEKEKPFVLPVGSSVGDLAGHIHKDLVIKLKYARIWGRNKYSGQKVAVDYILEDEDVIELHS